MNPCAFSDLSFVRVQGEQFIVKIYTISPDDMAQACLAYGCTWSRFTPFFLMM